METGRRFDENVEMVLHFQHVYDLAADFILRMAESVEVGEGPFLP